MSAWKRVGEPPERLPVSFVVTMKEDPELLEFLHNLPYRGASSAIKKILSSYVKAGGGVPDGEVAVMPAQPEKTAPVADDAQMVPGAEESMNILAKQYGGGD